MHEDVYNAPRKLLDSDEDWGLLTMLVVEEHEKEVDPVTADEAKRRFIAAKCPSVVFVLDWAERHPEKECLRFTNIHIKRVRLDSGEVLPQINGELDVGLSMIGVSPRLWLCYLSARIEELSAGDRMLFEDICHTYALMEESKEAKNVPESAYH